MTTYPFHFNRVDPSWRECLQRGLSQIDPPYLEKLSHSHDWLPGPDHLFNAFSLPLHQVNYVLFGESPYPRRDSANGYAFWDAAVTDLWSTTGLNKKVNRATSLRNIIKMLLIAEGLLDPQHTRQEDIARLQKSHLVQTNAAFFTNFLSHGFLLLNASLVLQATPPQYDARAWYPFINQLLDCLLENRPNTTFILLGRIASALDQFIRHHPQIKILSAEHPYNLSFITNHEVIKFFQPLHLLRHPPFSNLLSAM